MANSVTYFAALKAAEHQLTTVQQDPSAAQFLLLESQHWTFTQLVQHYRDVMPTNQLSRYQQQVTRVSAGEPAQYVLGHAPFYGREFVVSPATLIPRVETEELVEWVLNSQSTTAQRVLDVGTGSGAIAVTLQAERPAWRVTGTDISAAAIAVAQRNVQTWAPAVTLAVGDLFAPVAGQRFDVIVSNPPYIDRTETAVMDDSVKRYEPQTALFAAHHGLAFYQRFALALPTVLTARGNFFAELGYQQGAAVREIFQTALPTAHVTIRQDLSGHDRMVRVELTE
ncbi:peptide chain release factor N(5)-glutamine methyltransferase [Levilactobacillus acidifarinae]|uniref:Release factor glutamine methyltransferase n=1 Tax=Levilactobacillus acidifarinae DSM 19394 = JCM 15949 TaxID=1423715 RepID=A0A0R1LDG9_9LACO|nr:peptide chain release factor N(5)-glutamine methyltransferase [Levilactobacillus acidifarinae]KRK93803.1 methylase of polypeptide chain release factor [Levilactobacillus acidifarinae DSM 19394]GEO68686.1 release factor glutamine methyltransferase [Levilactobacillus acidifarinae]